MVDNLSFDNRDIFNRPVFIVAAPRSGSTLLFETLSRGAFWTVGGEAHEIFEGIPRLRIGAPGVDSNRLTAANADEATGAELRARFTTALRDRNGTGYTSQQPGKIRLLEKTPKNSLRIPFISTIFPDARYIYLYREARENISSIIEAWRSDRWITYRNIPGWEGSWSLLLPPNWISLRGKPTPDIAAFQWQSANNYILDDLEKIPAHKWITVSYTDLVETPARTIRRLCLFAGIPFDNQLAQVTKDTLPLSRYTQTPPSRDKWRKNANVLETVLPSLEKTIERINYTTLHKKEKRLTPNPPGKQKVGRNNPCPCGSGKKFKYCHGNTL